MSHYETPTDMTDISKLTLPQLRVISTRITREIEKRQALGKADLRKKMERLAKDAGLSLEDVLGTAPRAPKAPRAAPAAARKEPLPAKFVHPSNRELAWSGRGRRPGWIEAWTANGGTLEALENAASKMAKRARKAAEKQAAVNEAPAESHPETAAAE